LQLIFSFVSLPHHPFKQRVIHLLAGGCNHVEFGSFFRYSLSSIFVVLPSIANQWLAHFANLQKYPRYTLLRHNFKVRSMSTLYVGAEGILVKDAITQSNRNIFELQKKLNSLMVKDYRKRPKIRI